MLSLSQHASNEPVLEKEEWRRLFLVALSHGEQLERKKLSRSRLDAFLAASGIDYQVSLTGVSSVFVDVLWMTYATLPTTSGGSEELSKTAGVAKQQQFFKHPQRPVSMQLLDHFDAASGESQTQHSGKEDGAKHPQFLGIAPASANHQNNHQQEHQQPQTSTQLLVQRMNEMLTKERHAAFSTICSHTAHGGQNIVSNRRYRNQSETSISRNLKLNMGDAAAAEAKLNYCKVDEEHAAALLADIDTVQMRARRAVRKLVAIEAGGGSSRGATKNGAVNGGDRSQHGEQQLLLVDNEEDEENFDDLASSSSDDEDVEEDERSRIHITASAEEIAAANAIREKEAPFFNLLRASDDVRVPVSYPYLTLKGFMKIMKRIMNRIALQQRIVGNQESKAVEERQKQRELKEREEQDKQRAKNPFFGLGITSPNNRQNTSSSTAVTFTEGLDGSAESPVTSSLAHTPPPPPFGGASTPAATLEALGEGSSSPTGHGPPSLSATVGPKVHHQQGGSIEEQRDKEKNVADEAVKREEPSAEENESIVNRAAIAFNFLEGGEGDGFQQKQRQPTPPPTSQQHFFSPSSPTSKNQQEHIATPSHHPLITRGEFRTVFEQYFMDHLHRSVIHSDMQVSLNPLESNWSFTTHNIVATCITASMETLIRPIFRYFCAQTANLSNEGGELGGSGGATATMSTSSSNVGMNASFSMSSIRKERQLRQRLKQLKGSNQQQQLVVITTPTVQKPTTSSKKEGEKHNAQKATPQTRIRRVEKKTKTTAAPLLEATQSTYSPPAVFARTPPTPATTKKQNRKNTDLASSTSAAAAAFSAERAAVITAVFGQSGEGGQFMSFADFRRFIKTFALDAIIDDELVFNIFTEANQQDTKGLLTGQLDAELELDEFLDALLMIAIAYFSDEERKFPHYITVQAKIVAFWRMLCEQWIEEVKSVALIGRSKKSTASTSSLSSPFDAAMKKQFESRRATRRESNVLSLKSWGSSPTRASMGGFPVRAEEVGVVPVQPPQAKMVSFDETTSFSMMLDKHHQQHPDLSLQQSLLSAASGSVGALSTSIVEGMDEQDDVVIALHQAIVSLGEVLKVMAEDGDPRKVVSNTIRFEKQRKLRRSFPSASPSSTSNNDPDKMDVGFGSLEEPEAEADEQPLLADGELRFAEVSVYTGMVYPPCINVDRTSSFILAGVNFFNSDANLESSVSINSAQQFTFGSSPPGSSLTGGGGHLAPLTLADDGSIASMHDPVTAVSMLLELERQAQVEAEKLAQEERMKLEQELSSRLAVEAKKNNSVDDSKKEELALVSPPRARRLTAAQQQDAMDAARRRFSIKSVQSDRDLIPLNSPTSNSLTDGPLGGGGGGLGSTFVQPLSLPPHLQNANGVAVTALAKLNPHQKLLLSSLSAESRTQILNAALEALPRVPSVRANISVANLLRKTRGLDSCPSIVLAEHLFDNAPDLHTHLLADPHNVQNPLYGPSKARRVSLGIAAAAQVNVSRRGSLSSVASGAHTASGVAPVTAVSYKKATKALTGGGSSSVLADSPSTILGVPDETKNVRQVEVRLNGVVCGAVSVRKNRLKVVIPQPSPEVARLQYLNSKKKKKSGAPPNKKKIGPTKESTTPTMAVDKSKFLSCYSVTSTPLPPKEVRRLQLHYQHEYQRIVEKLVAAHNKSVEEHQKAVAEATTELEEVKELRKQLKKKKGSSFGGGASGGANGKIDITKIPTVKSLTAKLAGLVDNPPPPLIVPPVPEVSYHALWAREALARRVQLGRVEVGLVMPASATLPPPQHKVGAQSTQHDGKHPASASALATRVEYTSDPISIVMELQPRKYPLQGLSALGVVQGRDSKDDEVDPEKKKSDQKESKRADDLAAAKISFAPQGGILVAIIELFEAYALKFEYPTPTTPPAATAASDALTSEDVANTNKRSSLTDSSSTTTFITSTRSDATGAFSFSTKALDDASISNMTSKHEAAVETPPSHHHRFEEFPPFYMTYDGFEQLLKDHPTLLPEWIYHPAAATTANEGEISSDSESDAHLDFGATTSGADDYDAKAKEKRSTIPIAELFDVFALHRPLSREDLQDLQVLSGSPSKARGGKKKKKTTTHHHNESGETDDFSSPLNTFSFGSHTHAEENMHSSSELSISSDAGGGNFKNKKGGDPNWSIESETGGENVGEGGEPLNMNHPWNQVALNGWDFVTQIVVSPQTGEQHVQHVPVAVNRGNFTLSAAEQPPAVTRTGYDSTDSSAPANFEGAMSGDGVLPPTAAMSSSDINMSAFGSMVNSTTASPRAGDSANAALLSGNDTHRQPVSFFNGVPVAPTLIFPLLKEQRSNGVVSRLLQEGEENDGEVWGSTTTATIMTYIPHEVDNLLSFSGFLLLLLHAGLGRRDRQSQGTEIRPVDCSELLSHMMTSEIRTAVLRKKLATTKPSVVDRVYTSRVEVPFGKAKWFREYEKSMSPRREQRIGSAFDTVLGGPGSSSSTATPSPSLTRSRVSSASGGGGLNKVSSSAKSQSPAPTRKVGEMPPLPQPPTSTEAAKKRIPRRPSPRTALPLGGAKKKHAPSPSSSVKKAKKTEKITVVKGGGGDRPTELPRPEDFNSPFRVAPPSNKPATASTSTSRLPQPPNMTQPHGSGASSARRHPHSNIMVGHGYTTPRGMSTTAVNNSTTSSIAKLQHEKLSRNSHSKFSGMQLTGATPRHAMIYTQHQHAMLEREREEAAQYDGLDPAMAAQLKQMAKNQNPFANTDPLSEHQYVWTPLATAEKQKQSKQRRRSSANAEMYELSLMLAGSSGGGGQFGSSSMSASRFGKGGLDGDEDGDGTSSQQSSASRRSSRSGSVDSTSRNSGGTALGGEDSSFISAGDNNEDHSSRDNMTGYQRNEHRKHMKKQRKLRHLQQAAMLSGEEVVPCHVAVVSHQTKREFLTTAMRRHYEEEQLAEEEDSAL